MGSKLCFVAVVAMMAGCVAKEPRAIEGDSAPKAIDVLGEAKPWLIDADGDTDADGDIERDLDADESIPDVSPVDGGQGDAEGTDADEGCPGGRVHAITGECVECSETWHCTSLPVCDVARGVCVDFVASQCAPCRLDAPGTCGEGLECVDLGAEVVCLTSCEAGCPRSTECDGGHCLPVNGVSCTGWFSDARGSLCDGDGDCIPLGTAPGMEGCSGACYVACDSDDDCPPGRACDGDSCSW